MPQPEPAPGPTPAPAPAAAAASTAAAAPTSSDDGAPHLTIRIGSFGMLQAEMGAESEPVILEDLAAYGKALADAGGSAEIVIGANDGMAPLIARRAQAILADAGIEATLPN
jgi:hypothetical protein